MLFGLIVLALYGQGAALTYLTAYLLEQSLSIDNVFVFVLIFSELRIPAGQQRSVLLWGVLGALVMRALLIGAGLLLRSFEELGRGAVVEAQAGRELDQDAG